MKVGNVSIIDASIPRATVALVSPLAPPTEGSTLPLTASLQRRMQSGRNAKIKKKAITQKMTKYIVRASLWLCCAGWLEASSDTDNSRNRTRAGKAFCFLVNGKKLFMLLEIPKAQFTYYYIYHIRGGECEVYREILFRKLRTWGRRDEDRLKRVVRPIRDMLSANVTRQQRELSSCKVIILFWNVWPYNNNILGDNPRLARNKIINFNIYKIKRY